jgi:two-component system, NarL family, nitrate/nitrite response regulator NarL
MISYRRMCGEARSGRGSFMSSLVTPVLLGNHGKPEGVRQAVARAVDRSDTRRRVLVIDGDLLVAEAIASALTQLTFAARFVMPITSAHVRDLTAWRPGFVLLNVDTVEPDTSTSLVAMLSAATIPVAVVSSQLDRPVVGDCIDAGASTIVDKSCGLSELVALITDVLDGSAVLDDEAKRRILEPIRRQAQATRERLAPFDVLTQREKCVLAELMEGHAPEAIARRSTVSILTVRSQVKAILQKLGVNSQLAAVSFARRAGWSLEAATTHGVPPRGQASTA